MSDPLSYVPLAIAGADGTLNRVRARRLVAAGVALLQRCAPLVRALHGHRAAILLPTSSHMLVALAASSGRSALLLDPATGPEVLRQAIADADVAAVFTVAALAERLPPTMPRVLLDEAPERATWRHGDQARTIDLTLHGGLHLEGERDVPGAMEEVLVLGADDPQADALGSPLTHHRVLSCARATAARAHWASRDHTLAVVPFCRLFGLIVGALAPLVAGGRVTARDAMTPEEALALLEGEGVSAMVADRATFASILQALDARGRALDAPVLQQCLTYGEPLDDALARRWYHETGVLLHRGDVMGADGALAAWDEAG